MLVTMKLTAHLVQSVVQREGELIGRDGAPSPGPRVGGDVFGVDADPAHDGVRVVGPAGRCVVNGGDLRCGHVLGVDPRILRNGGVGPPQRGVALGGDRVVATQLVCRVGEVGGEVAGVGA
jgi:hypothetical protein